MQSVDELIMSKEWDIETYETGASRQYIIPKGATLAYIIVTRIVGEGADFQVTDNDTEYIRLSTYTPRQIVLGIKSKLSSGLRVDLTGNGEFVIGHDGHSPLEYHGE